MEESLGSLFIFEGGDHHGKGKSSTGKAYLYLLSNGQLKTHEGLVQTCIYTNHNNVATFVAKRLRFTCSAELGVVHNSVVWFAEQNDEYAKTILIEYEEAAILVLQARIDNHLQKIQALKANIHKLKSNLVPR